MKQLSLDQIIRMHGEIMRRTEPQGDKTLRDSNALISALESPFQTFGGQDLIPDLRTKAATLCHHIIANHPFVDGNKRIGVMAMIWFLHENLPPMEGKWFNPHYKVLIDIGLKTASGEWDVEQIEQAIRDSHEEFVFQKNEATMFWRFFHAADEWTKIEAMTQCYLDSLKELAK